MAEYIDSFKTAERDVPDTNVGDLISRQAALDIVFDFAETPHRMYQQIRELPTIDPVKHGKWMEENWMLMCSECGDAWGTEQEEEVRSFNYCPNCGAQLEVSDETN